MYWPGRRSQTTPASHRCFHTSPRFAKCWLAMPSSCPAGKPWLTRNAAAEVHLLACPVASWEEGQRRFPGGTEGGRARHDGTRSCGDVTGVGRPAPGRRGELARGYRKCDYAAGPARGRVRGRGEHGRERAAHAAPGAPLADHGDVSLRCPDGHARGAGGRPAHGQSLTCP